MPRRPREKSASRIYHVMLRGANHQEIFHEDKDCMKFLDLLERYKVQNGMRVHSWCLMGNHVHLVLEEVNEEISLTMKRVGVSYAWYYNNKYKTTGHLFQDRYRSERVENDRYLLALTRYIHQNPVKAGLVKKPYEWKWSSCSAYYGNQSYSPMLLDKEIILGMFSDDTKKAMDAFIDHNELNIQDEFLEDTTKNKMTDEEAREKIISIIEGDTLPEIKTLPKDQRKKVLSRIKKIEGISQRQAARILGISPNLLFKA